jgi:hypothetical protein
MYKNSEELTAQQQSQRLGAHQEWKIRLRKTPASQHPDEGDRQSSPLPDAPHSDIVLHVASSSSCPRFYAYGDLMSVEKSRKLCQMCFFSNDSFTASPEFIRSSTRTIELRILFALVHQMKNAVRNFDLIRTNPIRISLLRGNRKRKNRIYMSLILW